MDRFPHRAFRGTPSAWQYSAPTRSGRENRRRPGKRTSPGSRWLHASRNARTGTGNACASTRNARASTRNARASTGNARASTGNACASTGNARTSTGNARASTGNDHADAVQLIHVSFSL